MLKNWHKPFENKLFSCVPADNNWDIDPWASTLLINPQESAVWGAEVLF